MKAQKIPSRLHAVGNPEYQRLVGWAAEQTSISRSQAFDFINNLITAYEAMTEANQRFAGETPRMIHRQPKGIM
jgi:hypothetical protein